jgi:hypothetical protein
MLWSRLQATGNSIEAIGGHLPELFVGYLCDDHFFECPDTCRDGGGRHLNLAVERLQHSHVILVHKVERHDSNAVRRNAEKVSKVKPQDALQSGIVGDGRGHPQDALLRLRESVLPELQHEVRHVHPRKHGRVCDQLVGRHERLSSIVLAVQSEVRRLEADAGAEDAFVGPEVAEELGGLAGQNCAGRRVLVRRRNHAGGGRATGGARPMRRGRAWVLRSGQWQARLR